MDGAISLNAGGFVKRDFPTTAAVTRRRGELLSHYESLLKQA